MAARASTPPLAGFSAPGAPAAPDAPDAPAARDGHGRLVVARRGGESRVLSAYARTPLQLVIPRARGATAWAFVTNHGGGLVDGDDVSLSIDVEAGARALVTTQASTKVYRRRGSAGGEGEGEGEGAGESRAPGGASQRLDGRVGEGALLALLPDPICCFAGASFTQRTAIDVARGGALVLVEALVAGRVASGERWAFARYDSTIALSLAGTPQLHERVLLSEDDGAIAARMGRFDAFATCVVVGDALAAEARALLDALSDARLDARVARHASAHVAASPLGASGVLIRVAADGAETLSKRVRGILDFLPRHLGDDPFARKL